MAHGTHETAAPRTRTAHSEWAQPCAERRGLFMPRADGIDIFQIVLRPIRPRARPNRAQISNWTLGEAHKVFGFEYAVLPADWLTL